MGDRVEEQRREAVGRVHAGEPVAAVAEDMGRSQPWVRKWVDRYDPDDEAWAASRSRAPKTVANRTDADTEALVVKVREDLDANPWAQVGPAAIAWELEKLGVDDPPSLRTISRILVRHDLPRRPRRNRYEPKGTDYPAPPDLQPNACQQADLVGPATCTAGSASTRSTRSIWAAARPAGPSPRRSRLPRPATRSRRSGRGSGCRTVCRWTTSRP